MTFGKRGLLAVMALIFVSGCAGVQAVPYDSSNAGAIKTVGLITPGTSGQPRAILATTVGQSFGLIGAIVDAGMQEARESDMEALLAGQQFSATDKFTADLTKALEGKGYKVVTASAARKDKSAMVETYPGSAQGVDAYLDVSFEYGVIAAGITGSTPYRPFTYARCRLVKASDSSVLMEDMVFYNALNAPKGHVVLAPDPAYVFTDFDAVTSDPKKTTEGINVAIASTTNAIGQLLQ